MTIYEKNTAKIKELMPVAQWSAQKAMDECFSQEMHFEIREAYRTQERQNELYAQGRTKRGNIVTWTLSSDHTKRAAIDIYPINCTHEQIAPIFAKWGIAHPWPSADPPHYACNDTLAMLTARLAFHLRAAPRISDPLRRAVLSRSIAREQNEIERIKSERKQTVDL